MTDFFTIGNDEFKGPLDKTVLCPYCGEVHEVHDSDPPLLQFVRCPETGKSYLVGIKRQAI